MPTRTIATLARDLGFREFSVTGAEPGDIVRCIVAKMDGEIIVHAGMGTAIITRVSQSTTVGA